VLVIDLGNSSSGGSGSGSSSGGSGGGGGAAPLAWSVEVPLHAKYSQPVSTGATGLRWLLSGEPAREARGRRGGAQAAAAQPQPARSRVPCPDFPHGRAHSPVPAPRPTPPPGSLDLEVPPPWVVFTCRGGGAPHAWAGGARRMWPKGGAQLALRPPDGAPRVLWRVPAGNLDHGPVVAAATAAVSLSCSGAVVWAAVRSALGRGAAARAAAKDKRL
jgi:hypothetical protein